MDEDELRRYLDAAAHARALTPEEEAVLVRAMSDGDDVAEGRLIDANRHLVLSIVDRCSDRGLPRATLVDAGHSGLVTAVERFDHTKGFRFSTYATWWIRQSIARRVAEQG